MHLREGDVPDKKKKQQQQKKTRRWFAYIIKPGVLIKSPELLGLNRPSVIFTSA